MLRAIPAHLYSYVRLYLCLFYLNRVFFAVLDVIPTLTKMSNFYGSFFILIMSKYHSEWHKHDQYCGMAKT